VEVDKKARSGGLIRTMMNGPQAYYAPQPQQQPPFQSGAGPAAQGQFPPQLAGVPAAAVAHEAFGWLPALCACASWVVAYFLFSEMMRHSRFEQEPLLMAGGAVLLGVLLAAYEIWRRLRRTSLVTAAGRVAIYRNGTLAQVVGYGQISKYQLSVINPIRYLMLPVMLTGGAGLGFLGGLPKEGFRVPWFLATVWGGLLIASLARTRVIGNRYFIPKGNGSTEEILLDRPDTAKIFTPGR
jgi:type IV secretory pathway TrbD component